MKNYKVIPPKAIFMKIDNLVVGIIVIFFAAILLADAYLTTYTPANELFSPNDVKGIAGMVFVVMAGFIFWKARK